MAFKPLQNTETTLAALLAAAVFVRDSRRRYLSLKEYSDHLRTTNKEPSEYHVAQAKTDNARTWYAQYDVLEQMLLVVEATEGPRNDIRAIVFED